MYNDIVILPVTENMNDGKSHAYFSWAAENAWVPPHYNNITPDQPRYKSYNYFHPPPSKLAPHDPVLAHDDQLAGKATPWVRPDFVVKMDDDAFLMMAELETRLRVELNRKSDFGSTKSGTLDPLIYWGYMVSNQFHTFIAGEIYALSWRLVGWVASDPAVKELTIGAEDKLTSRWMRTLHPQASEIRWVTERCWIYDHPRANSVYVRIVWHSFYKLTVHSADMPTDFFSLRKWIECAEI